MSEFTPIPSDDELGKWVRDAWVHWAKTQTWRSPDPRWLVPWEELQQDGMDREADREIGKALWEHFTAITDLSRERDRYLGVLRQWPYRFCSPPAVFARSSLGPENEGPHKGNFWWDE